MSIRSRVNTGLKAFEKPFVVHNNVLISRAAVLNNFDVFAKLSPGGMVIPVLKSNAYGHGLEEVATILKERASPYLAVDGYFEALRIRAVSRQPVLVMGAIAPENFERMTFGNDAFVVGDERTVEALGQTGRRVRVHVELETGMRRYGVAMDDLAGLLAAIKRYPRLELEGVMSHLADADNPRDDSYTMMQAERFDHGVEQVLAAGFAPKYVHLAQSAGSVKAHSKYANAVRVGIAMYGVSPFIAGDPAAGELSTLRPVLELRSTITKILDINEGETVSYGGTFMAQRKSRIGVLPLGYFEGVPRVFSNAGQVKWGNDYAPIVGRVCMNHTMIDVTDLGAEVGDEVVVIGADRGEAVSVESVCARHDLFSYELMVRLQGSLRRRIV